MKLLLSTLFTLSAGFVWSQSANLTPVTDIGMHTVTVTVPAKFASLFPAGRTLRVPSNYTASIYYTGSLSKPRFMAFSPAGVLTAGNSVTTQRLLLAE